MRYALDGAYEVTPAKRAFVVRVFEEHRKLLTTMYFVRSHSNNACKNLRKSNRCERKKRGKKKERTCYKPTPNRRLRKLRDCLHTNSACKCKKQPAELSRRRTTKTTRQKQKLHRFPPFYGWCQSPHSVPFTVTERKWWQ